MNNQPTVDVVLATYNGARYLPDLLDSLLSQSYSDYNLLVRDDGSTDQTREILTQYQQRFNERMVVLANQTPTKSACGNFLALMEHSTAKYTLFCDQDDVWMPNKIEATVSSLADVERKKGPETPAFWFCDAIPVDNKLCPIHESYWKSRRIKPEVTTDIRKSLLSGIANGCMSGINQSLRERALPVNPNDIIGHDWYLVQLAALIGHVAWSPERLLYYRQHNHNVSGASHRTGLLTYLSNSEKKARVRRGLANRRRQAATILRLHAPLIHRDTAKVIKDFISIGSQGRIRRRLSIIRGGFLYDDFARNLGMLLFC